MQTSLDGVAWHAVVCHGAKKVISQREYLNKINVFPIADGDTGNNLSLLMRAILLKSLASEEFSLVTDSLARASLAGAQGNSGAIFAQFFFGFQLTEPLKAIPLTEFGQLALEAAATAKKAVMTPVTGTILTVMEAWGQACAQLCHEVAHYDELLQKAYLAAEQALANTTQQLAILTQTKNVDAGAQGFVYFLAGMLEYWQNDFTIESADTAVVTIPQLEANHLSHDMISLPQARYCTEVLIKQLTCSIAVLKQHAHTYGDSLVIAGNEKCCRLHIHTNNPAKLIECLSEFGQLEEQKVDDMVRQFDMVTRRKNEIALLIDSSADLPQNLLDMYQIHVLPMQIQIDEVSYLDRYTINSEQVYDALLTQQCSISTAMPKRGLLEKKLLELAQYYRHILVMTVAGVQSGTYQLIQKTLANTRSPAVVIDSQRNSAAYGLMVFKAAKFIEQGYSFNDIQTRLETLNKRANIFVAVKDLSYMVRSGRLNKHKAKMVNFLGIKPVVSLDADGKGYIAAKAFGFTSAVNKITQMVRAKKNRLQHYAVVYVVDVVSAKKLANELTKKLGMPPLFMMPVSSVVGIHAGPGSVAVAFIEQDD